MDYINLVTATYIAKQSTWSTTVDKGLQPQANLHALSWKICHEWELTLDSHPLIPLDSLNQHRTAVQ